MFSSMLRSRARPKEKKQASTIKIQEIQTNPWKEKTTSSEIITFIQIGKITARNGYNITW
jgi:hypothetical protein